MYKHVVWALLMLFALTPIGCSKKTEETQKADENKPLSEVRAEVEKLNVEQLSSMISAYKNAISAKQKEIDVLAEKLKEMPTTDMTSDKAKTLVSEIKSLNKSLAALNERLDIYENKLKGQKNAESFPNT